MHIVFQSVWFCYRCVVYSSIGSGSPSTSLNHDWLFTSSVLANHLQDRLLGLLLAGSVQIMSATLDQGERRLGRGSEQLDLLFWDSSREDRILLSLQPVYWTLDISEAADETIPLHEVEGCHAKLLATFLAAVHFFHSLIPKGQDFLADSSREAQASNHASPDLINNKIRIGDRPLLQERSEVVLGVPSALLT
jgi:hypothetical protein